MSFTNKVPQGSVLDPILFLFCNWSPGFKGPLNKVKWDAHTPSHTSKLMVSYNRKLNLLKSFYFLPIQARLDFYFKVILPSITYGILIWGSVGKTAL